MKKLFKNTLFIGIILFVLFFVARFILGQFGLMFRAWINFIWLASSFILFIWGFIKFYNSVQNKIAKRVLSIITAVVIIFAIIPLPFPIGLTLAIDWAGEIGAFPNREDVIEYDGYKIVGYHRFAFWDSEVEFYEYKNPFVVGNHCLLWCYGYDYDNYDGHFYAYDEFHSFTIKDIVDNIKN